MTPSTRRNLFLMRLLILTGLAILLIPGLLLGAEVKLEPVKDTTIYFDEEGNLASGSGDYLFAGINGSNGDNRIMRALIAFDLSEIPAGSKIESVTLYLKQELPRNDLVQREISLHHVQKDWGEGGSDADGGSGPGSGGADGAPAEEGDATWLHTFFNDTFWTNPGGDFEETASASKPVGGNDGYFWSSDPLLGGAEQLISDVQGWVDDPSTNFGWLIKGPEALDGANYTARRFLSRHVTAVNTRPELTIEYQEPTPGPEFVFPQFVIGDGNATRWILRNNSSTEATGYLAFLDANGESTQVPIGGGMTDRYNFTLNPWGSLSVTSDPTGGLDAGAAHVFVETGSASDMEAAEVFFLLGRYVSVTGARPEKKWQAYVSRNDEENSGIAVQNPDRSSAAVLKLTLLDASGQQVATDELTLLPGRRIAQFLGEDLILKDYFEQNPGPFEGTLNVEVIEGEDVALVGLIQKIPSGALIAVEATNNPYVSEPQR